MRSVLVTGVTGTFGQAFLDWCRQGGGCFGRIVGYSRDEWKQSVLAERYEKTLPALRMFLGDVRDPARLAMAMRGVDVVVHAAALKRIDAGTYSPSEMIATNVNGTMNVVNEAIKAHAKRVVVISSDKACAPTNLYGMTKGCAESYAVHANTYGYPGGTFVTAVRYGNVLGSRGSVVQKWQDQARRGDPLTLTSPDMTRFIMTIEQAVELVWFAITRTRGGEIYIPVLDTARMLDLARAIDGNAVIETTGLRPGGEKLAEQLLNDEEPARTRRLGDRAYLSIVPGHHEWTAKDEWSGEPCGDAARNYRSDRPGPLGNRRLTVEQLRVLLQETGALQK